MIEVAKLLVTLETLEALKTESLSASRFEQANVYDRARIEIDRRGSGSPEFPKNRVIG